MDKQHGDVAANFSKHRKTVSHVCNRLGTRVTRAGLITAAELFDENEASATFAGGIIAHQSIAEKFISEIDADKYVAQDRAIHSIDYLNMWLDQQLLSEQEHAHLLHLFVSISAPLANAQVRMAEYLLSLCKGPLSQWSDTCPIISSKDNPEVALD